jgi:transcription initiation factor TFIID subunit 13
LRLYDVGDENVTTETVRVLVDPSTYQLEALPRRSYSKEGRLRVTEPAPVAALPVDYNVRVRVLPGEDLEAACVRTRRESARRNEAQALKRNRPESVSWSLSQAHQRARDLELELVLDQNFPEEFPAPNQQSPIAFNQDITPSERETSALHQAPSSNLQFLASASDREPPTFCQQITFASHLDSPAYNEGFPSSYPQITSPPPRKLSSWQQQIEDRIAREIATSDYRDHPDPTTPPWSLGRAWERTEVSRTSATQSVSLAIRSITTSISDTFTVSSFLHSHGDVQQPLELTKKVLDELLTDFITETCFEAHRSAQLAGRQKIKLDDIKFACRKNPRYLGKIEETLDKKVYIDASRKLIDGNDDKITKSSMKAMEEEPLGADDDDAETELKGVAGRSKNTGSKK